MRRALGCAAALAPCLIAGGCASGPRPPEVEGAVAASVPLVGVDLASARRGHDFYVTSCARCHEAVMPGSLSMEAWDRILPRMVKAARLDTAAHADIRAYIAAARDAAERGAALGG